MRAFEPWGEFGRKKKKLTCGMELPSKRIEARQTQRGSAMNLSFEEIGQGQPSGGLIGLAWLSFCDLAPLMKRTVLESKESCAASNS